MRNVLCFALLAPILALAAGTTQPVTALAPENGTVNVTVTPSPAPAGQGQPGIPPRALVGTLDTIGGTTYDWWTNGPRLSAIVNSPTYGVHALWMYSTATTGTDFPDRNMRYNFYDITSHAWNWVDADYMQSGVNVFDKRAGYGNIVADPATGNAIVGGHVPSGSNVVPRVARDAAPGAGIFEYADGEPVLGVCQWAPIAVNQDGQISIFPITAAYDLSYSHIKADSWPTFSTPMTGIVPSPLFPTHNIAASKVSSKVALTWSISTTTGIEDGYVDFSTDGGVTWGGPTLLELPVAYGNGSDTVTSCHLTSLFPWYDAQDRFHIAANLMPMINDTGYILPSQIWHYCPDNAEPWSRIHVASVDPANYLYPIGYNATLACRPTLGQDDDGNLFVAWEQFDTLNNEPTTSRARADIWAARSTDNGASWGEGLKLTDAGTHSMRFPSVIDLAVEGDPDTMYVIYLDDSIAGFCLYSEGAYTPNPVVVQKVPVDAIPVKPGAVSEQRAITPLRLDVAASPNPFGRSTRLSYVVPHRGNVSLDIFDAAGRNVRALACGRSEAGRFDATWDGRSQSGALVPEGVYLYRYALDGKRVTGKLTLTR
jgi:hypothetical protein